MSFKNRDSMTDVIVTSAYLFIYLKIKTQINHAGLQQTYFSSEINFSFSFFTTQFLVPYQRQF